VFSGHKSIYGQDLSINIIMNSIKKRNLPAFIELPHIVPNVDDLIKSFDQLSHRKNNSYEMQFAEIRDELASNFPFEKNGYDYVVVTDIDEQYKIDIKKESPIQMYKNVMRGKAPALDCRNYVNFKEDVPIAVREFLQQFKGQVSRTRFAVLKSKMTIYEHADNGIHHTIRVHVPLISDDKNLFFIRSANGIEYKYLEPGKVYYTNTALPHFVINNSNIDRLHLVLSLNSLDDIVEYIK